MSLCRKTTPAGPKEPATGLQLYDWLKRYKSDGHPGNRRQFSAHLMIILGWFLERHWACLSARGPIDVMTVVPSTRRTGLHPLHEALGMLDGRPVPVKVLLQRGPGVITRKESSDDGYIPTVDVAGRGVLIVDDTYTTGSHAQSAASALSLAGANVVGIVPIGRLIDPDYGDNRTYWDRRVSEPFSFDTCCLESPPGGSDEWEPF